MRLLCLLFPAALLLTTALPARAQDDGPTLEETLDWIEDAHLRVGKGFTGSIMVDFVGRQLMAYPNFYAKRLTRTSELEWRGDHDPSDCQVGYETKQWEGRRLEEEKISFLHLGNIEQVSVHHFDHSGDDMHRYEPALRDGRYYFVRLEVSDGRREDGSAWSGGFSFYMGMNPSIAPERLVNAYEHAAALCRTKAEDEPF